MKSPELQRIFRLVDVNQAVALTIENSKIDLEEELVPTQEAMGRVASRELVAADIVPKFNQAFYDGYAVRSLDTENASLSQPVRLRVIGSMKTIDNPETFKLGANEAVYTPSGAPIPEGGDTILRCEEAEFQDDHLLVRRRIPPGENVIQRGHDMMPGDKLIVRGQILRAQDIGLAMELGLTHLKVFRKVRVGILSVGSDLVHRSRGGIPFPDNYAWIAKLYLELWGAQVRNYGIAADDAYEINSRIDDMVRENDLCLLMGGASVARDDIVPAVLSNLGKIVFHGIRISPGKVTGMASIGGKPVFMVPGHIGSTLACLFLLVIPLLTYNLYGKVDPYVKVKAKLVSEVESKPRSYAFRTVSLKWSGHEYLARPIYKQLGGSPFLTLFTEANGFIIVEPDKIPSVGDEIMARLFSHMEIPHIKQ